MEYNQSSKKRIYSKKIVKNKKLEYFWNIFFPKQKKIYDMKKNNMPTLMDQPKKNTRKKNMSNPSSQSQG